MVIRRAPVCIGAAWIAFASMRVEAENQPPAPSQPAPPPAESAFSAVPFVGRQDTHQWDRHVRGFRREHNFALSSGVSSGTWTVKKFGTLQNRKFDTTGVYTKFQYSYHLQLYRGFGYMLGSSIGYHYEAESSQSPFRPVSVYQFPGLLAGLVVNINPVFRLSTAVDAYLERHNGLKERDGIPPDPEIAVTIQAYDAGVFFDLFYDLSWALRLEAHRRHLDYQKPLHADGFDVDANLKKDDRWLGLGLVYHLL